MTNKTATAPVSSMTGYANIAGGAEGVRWTFEARSVNGRGLDIKLRLPSGWDVLDGIIKDQCRKHLVRGNVSISVQIESDQADTAMSLNESLVRQLTEIADKAAAITGQTVSLDNILTIRGVLEEAEPTRQLETTIEAVQASITTDIEALISALQTARRAEGSALHDILKGHRQTLGDLIVQAEGQARTIPDELRSRLTQSIEELTRETDISIAEERLAQEVVMLATKADVREEIDRLKAHMESLDELLGEGRGIGRRLDFLAQEFNREANTLCSKSSTTGMTKTGLALKTVIDQLREQVQNVE